MHEKILETLKKTEQDKGIKIIYACESGSRAWGFSSNDSDYDARFIYMHKPEHYLSVFEDKRDVVELPINDLLDVNGWDLKKALALLHKNNLALFEWINSPVVYIDCGVKEMLSELVNDCFKTDRAHYHYYSMASSFYKNHIDGIESPNLKKLFYCLRTTLADLYIMEYGKMPPVDFNLLLIDELIPASLQNEIKDLMAEKLNKDESDSSVNCVLTVLFLQDSLQKLRSWKPESNNVSRRKVDLLFRDLLNKFKDF